MVFKNNNVDQAALFVIWTAKWQANKTPRETKVVLWYLIRRIYARLELQIQAVKVASKFYCNANLLKRQIVLYIWMIAVAHSLVKTNYSMHLDDAVIFSLVKSLTHSYDNGYTDVWIYYDI